MDHRHRALLIFALCVASGPLPAQASRSVRDVVLQFVAADGTPLEAKLSLPAAASGRIPVVFQLHGAGPRNYDNAVRYRDAAGQVQVLRYYDYYAEELAKHGLAFFRMSKRGNTLSDSGARVSRTIFSKATPSVLLDDYQVALDQLRLRPEIDSTRIVLMGSSEGTRLAPLLALRSPSGLTGLVLMSHQSDNGHDTVVWQNTVGPWRNVEKLIPAASDGRVTRAEYDSAAAADASISARLPFAAMDTDKDGVMTRPELQALVKPRLDAILKAVEEGNDDLIWQAVVNLSSAYLLEFWNSEPTSAILLQLDLPIGIFHGELDGATRVEGVRETEAAFRAAGRSNLHVRIYPGHDHDLNWTPRAALAGELPAFRDAFAFASELTRPRPPRSR
jgi:pimeloyl-ACP methyl ester carboxylesterase